MQKKLLILSLTGVSAASIAAVATGVRPESVIRALPVAVQSAGTYPQAQAQPALPPTPSYSVSPAIANAISRWNSLRQSDNHPFSSYASFLTSYRGWPGEAAMRRNAERVIIPDSTSASEVVAFFRSFPPLTPTGHARHAFALLATGRPDEARDAARRAWTGGVLPKPDEDRVLSLFGSALSVRDHDARMETLLGNGDTQSAGRMLTLVSSAERPVYEARLALQTRAASASELVGRIGTISGDPGLLMDRANWLRASGQSLAARQLLAQPRRLTKRPANAEKWFETLLTMARGAANDSQWATAYQIASQIDDAYDPGTDISLLSYGERDEYTSLAWLAGSTALNKLGRPADATRMFERYARAARSPQTRSKGFYWAARAAHAAGQTAQSSVFLEEAARSPDQFYGQLANERLGRPIVAPSAASVPIDPAARSQFASQPLVQALRALGDMGRWTDQSLFVRAVAEQVATPHERLLAADLGRSIGRQDLGVWVAREARNKGETFYFPTAFPQVQIPAPYAHNWALAHGITRQESSFDRAAVSSANARGMMQLVSGTARETAGKLGLPYDYGRLTSDPEYNVMLGSAYFQTLLNQWGGNVPLAVASYNAGAGNVRRWVRENGDPRMGGDILKWIEDIPFFETRNYVQRVLENAVVYDAIRSPNGTGSRNRLSQYLGKRTPG